MRTKEGYVPMQAVALELGLSYASVHRYAGELMRRAGVPLGNSGKKGRNYFYILEADLRILKQQYLGNYFDLPWQPKGADRTEYRKIKQRGDARRAAEAAHADAIAARHRSTTPTPLLDAADAASPVVPPPLVRVNFDERLMTSTDREVLTQLAIAVTGIKGLSRVVAKMAGKMGIDVGDLLKILPFEADHTDAEPQRLQQQRRRDG